MLPRLSQAARARLAELANRQPTIDEWWAQAAIPLSPHEIELTLEVARWFRRRYREAGEIVARARSPKR